MNPATATTSLNQIPALHKFVATLGLSVFDFGAGKKGKIDEFYHNLRLPYFPFDPFNRDKKENAYSWRFLEDEGTDVVACANVLNVLNDSELENCVWNLASATRQTNKGVCFVSVYYAPRFGHNLQRKGYVQRNQPPSFYVPYLEKCFDKVWNLSKFLVCSTH